MLKMEDSGIDSDTRSNSNGCQNANIYSSGVVFSPGNSDSPCSVKFSGETDSVKITHQNIWSRDKSFDSANEDVSSPTTCLISTSKLQKRLEKQILQAKKIRQQEQTSSSDAVPKKLIPRNRLKVPKSSNQMPVVTKADSHPLVSWESESDEDEFDFHPMSKKSTREVTEQLIKDGFNLDLTPDDEDLDLIPPKPLEKRCICCNPVQSCNLL